MILKKWDALPNEMQNNAVRPYYEILKKKKIQLILKRIFDIFGSIVLIIILSPIILFFCIWIKIDSKGPIFYRQERITQYGKVFRIFKFRTMMVDADKVGTLVTTKNDFRITKVGKKIRKYRIDEIPQLFNVLSGKMSFVGTRPEVKKYVEKYTDEMYATLLLPAGITSLASIKFKNEDELLLNSSNMDKKYVDDILPIKMKFNLHDIKKFSFFRDILIMIRTIITIIL